MRHDFDKAPLKFVSRNHEGVTSDPAFPPIELLDLDFVLNTYSKGTTHNRKCVFRCVGHTSTCCCGSVDRTVQKWS
jgi:hypothetical protein